MARTHNKKQDKPSSVDNDQDDSCRLDKWLWAAR
ncbi:MAG: hypothetical protein ACT6QL_06195, partial [Methylophilus sp.]